MAMNLNGTNMQRSIGAISRNSPRLVTGIFWEVFSAASAITALLRNGFLDGDVHVVGVLEGNAAAISEFLLAVGLPSEIVNICGDSFDDGVVLVMVRVDQVRNNERIAIELLERHGGMHTGNEQLCGPKE
jgi:hypothetical protein